jgi:hypothetical protein
MLEQKRICSLLVLFVVVSPLHILKKYPFKGYTKLQKKVFLNFLATFTEYVERNLMNTENMQNESVHVLTIRKKNYALSHSTVVQGKSFYGFTVHVQKKKKIKIKK